jgi:hypothetical protein
VHERVTVLHHFESTGAPGTSMSLRSPSSSRSSSAVSLCRELCRRRISRKQGNLLINEVAVFVCTCLFHLKHFPSSSPPHEPSLKSHHRAEKWAPRPEKPVSSQEYVSWQTFAQKNEKNRGKEVQEARRGWNLSNPSYEVDVQEEELFFRLFSWSSMT